MGNLLMPVCWPNNLYGTTLEVGRRTRIFPFMTKVVISWRWSKKRNTSSAKKRFVVVSSRALGTARLEDLSLTLLKVKCPVVAVEERLMIPLPSRARRLIASRTLLPIESCAKTHWGQGYPETSGNILGTFQGLGQFYCTVTNRYIYGTFRMCC